MTDPSWNAVVLDLDGTVLNSHAVMTEAFRAAWAEVAGTRAAPLGKLESRQGRPFVAICQEFSWPEGLPTVFARESHTRAAQVTVFPGVVGLLTELFQEGTHLAILTGKDRGRTEALIQQHDLAHLFDALVCGDDPMPGKPNPTGLSYLIDRMGATPETACYVGDSLIDRQCAEALGVDFVAVEWPDQPQQLNDGPRSGEQLIRDVRDLASRLRVKEDLWSKP